MVSLLPLTASVPAPHSCNIIQHLYQTTSSHVLTRWHSRTCIDGHRAPLCDPKKHRNKIMYRRPNPGRPARQCGHPKSVQCDCLAKRTLCCVLTNEQWDEVTEGKIVTVAMYDSMEDLDNAQGKVRDNAPSPASAASPARGSSNLASGAPTPQNTRFQMFGVGGPHGTVEQPMDPFAWSGIAPEILSHHQSPIDVPSPTSVQNMHTFQAMPSTRSERAHSSSHTQPQFGQFQVSLPPAAQTPGSISSGPYTPYGHMTPSSATSYSMDDPSTPLDARVVALQRQMSSNLDLSHMNSGMPSPYTNGQPRTMSMDPTTISPPIMSPQSMHIDMSMPPMLQNMPAPAPRPSQSCCSKKSKQPRPQMQMFDSYMYPGSAPSQQFPCPSCASTLCTCSNCPSTMQSFEFGGAWAQACGRTGHLDNGFPTSLAFAAQEMHSPPIMSQEAFVQPQPPQPQQQQSSCCSSNRQPAHQPVDSFNGMNHFPSASDWPSGLPYGMQPIRDTTSVDQHTVNPSLLHDDTMMWQ